MKLFRKEILIILRNLPEINIDFETYLPSINTFKNYYDILRSNDKSTDASMKTLQTLLKSKELQRN